MKNNVILTTICAIAGCIIVAVMGTAVAHVGSMDIHQPQNKNIVRQPEFQQFQERVIDRLDDIKLVQQVMQEDIKAIRNGN